VYLRIEDPGEVGQHGVYARDRGIFIPGCRICARLEAEKRVSISRSKSIPDVAGCDVLFAIHEDSSSQSEVPAMRLVGVRSRAELRSEGKTIRDPAPSRAARPPDLRMQDKTTTASTQVFTDVL
jgi:hypothetical protein